MRCNATGTTRWSMVLLCLVFLDNSVLFSEVWRYVRVAGRYCFGHLARGSE